MNLKKWKVISPFIIFGLASLIHFVYQLFPNIITSFFAPVNESIIEHMKLIYTSIIVFSFIEYMVFKKYNIQVNNIGINPFIEGCANILIFLCIYLPLRHILNENMVFTLIALFISNIIVSVISYKVLTSKPLISNKLGIILSLLIFIPFIYFTYYPIHNNLFYDTKNEIYGIKKDA